METKPLNILQHPDQIDSATLREMMVQYPWFSILHVLWLIKVRQENPDAFNEELKKHVIYLKDRKRLYQLINTDLWNKLVLDSMEKNKQEQVPPSSADENENTDLLDFSYNPGNADEETAENRDSTDTIDIQKDEAPVSDERLSDENQDSEETESTKKEAPSPGFTAWIDELDMKSGEKYNLIDRFLEIDPGPIRPDKETSLKGDVSKKSVEENEHLLTDTLAKIYLKQGLYTKAIFAYEKLSLKYPEKSDYFASQIEEIKNLINNK